MGRIEGEIESNHEIHQEYQVADHEATSNHENFTYQSNYYPDQNQEVQMQQQQQQQFSQPPPQYPPPPPPQGNNQAYGANQPFQPVQYPPPTQPNNRPNQPVAYPPQNPQQSLNRPVQYPPQNLQQNPVQYTPPEQQAGPMYQGGLNQPNPAVYPPSQQQVPVQFPPANPQQKPVQFPPQSPQVNNPMFPNGSNQPASYNQGPQSLQKQQYVQGGGVAEGMPVMMQTKMMSPVPQGMQVGYEGWRTGLFDCMDDPMNAVITFFFPCLTFGQIAEIVDNGTTSCGTSGLLYGLIAAVIYSPCIFSCTYRTKLRNKFGLPESPAPDWITHFLCEQCALCQEYRELQLRGLDPTIGWQGNVARNPSLQQPQVVMVPPMNQQMMG